MAQTGWAAKAYVTDSFRISFRGGPSTENKILKFLASGQPVEVFEAQEGWSRVRPIQSGQGSVEGWVLTRYLITRQPWEIQVQSLKQENTELKEKLASIDKEWKETLRRETTQETLQTLTKENESLRSSQRNKWFASGALVLFCGLIIGRQQKERRSSLYS